MVAAAERADTGRRDEVSAAIHRVRELAIKIAGEKVTQHKEFWGGPLARRYLEVTKDFVPETKEQAAEWARIRALVKQVARQQDRAMLANWRAARGDIAPLAQTVASQPATPRPRARKSRPARRARSGTDPSEPGDLDADPLGREAAA